MYVNNDGDNDDDDNDDNDDCGALITSHTLTRGERDPCMHVADFSSIGLLGKLEVFLTQRIRFLENIALALTLPG